MSPNLEWQCMSMTAFCSYVEKHSQYTVFLYFLCKYLYIFRKIFPFFVAVNIHIFPPSVLLTNTFFSSLVLWSSCSFSERRYKQHRAHSPPLLLLSPPHSICSSSASSHLCAGPKIPFFLPPPLVNLYPSFQCTFPGRKSQWTFTFTPHSSLLIPLAAACICVYIYSSAFSYFVWCNDAFKGGHTRGYLSRRNHVRYFNYTAEYHWSIARDSRVAFM